MSQADKGSFVGNIALPVLFSLDPFRTEISEPTNVFFDLTISYAHSFEAVCVLVLVSANNNYQPKTRRPDICAG